MWVLALNRRSDSSRQSPARGTWNRSNPIDFPGAANPAV